MSYTKIYANDNSATYAVIAQATGVLTWDSIQRTITQERTGQVWRLRNHSKGGIIIRPVRATGAKSI